MPPLPKTEVFGVVNDDGSEIVVWGLLNSVDKWTWLSSKELEELKEDRDHFSAPRLANFHGKLRVAKSTQLFLVVYLISHPSLKSQAR